MIKCVAFDMDDTLYDEIDYYRSGFKVVSAAIANDFGLNCGQVFDVLWSVFNGGNHKTAFDETARKFEITFDGQYTARLVDIFRNHKPDIVLPSDSGEALDALKKNYKLGLITDGWLPAQEYKVKALGLEQFFDCIIYTEKLGAEHWKPSPKGFEKLLADIGAVGCQSVYVGDNLKKDFISPNKMGFITIKILRNNGIHLEPAPSPDAAAQYEIHSITELIDLLKKIDV